MKKKEARTITEMQNIISTLELQNNYLTYVNENKNNALYLIATVLRVYLESENPHYEDLLTQLMKVCSYATNGINIMQEFDAEDEIIHGKNYIHNLLEKDSFYQLSVLLNMLKENN